MYSESRCQKVNLLRAAIVYYHYYKYGICAVGRRRAFLCIVDQEWSAHLYPPPVIRSRLRPAWEGRGSVCLVQAPVVFFFGGRRLLRFLSAFCGLRVSKMRGGRTAAFFRTPPCAPTLFRSGADADVETSASAPERLVSAFHLTPAGL